VDNAAKHLKNRSDARSTTDKTDLLRLAFDSTPSSFTST
jgi:hypothetical protein